MAKTDTLEIAEKCLGKVTGHQFVDFDGTFKWEVDGVHFGLKELEAFRAEIERGVKADALEEFADEYYKVTKELNIDKAMVLTWIRDRAAELRAKGGE